MSYTPTSLLSLPIITTGTESGTWGGVVDNGLTQYLDIAIAGTLPLTSASFTANAITLANTAGDTNATNIAGTTAQYAVIKVSSLTNNVTITAPSTSKVYLVDNADSTYTVTIKATGQTGYTVAKGTKAWVYYNGTDYVLASTNDITKLTGILPVANGGTGLSSGTSGGVLYYSASGTLASSAALAANAIVLGGGAGAAPATTTTGTGVVTALGVAVGSAGAFVVNGGALGTPSSGTVTNLTGTASININGTVGATTANTGAFTSITSTSASGISTIQAATQDGVKLLGRAGGTGSYLATITPTTLTASRTVTLPDADTTVPVATQVLTFSGPTAARTITLPDSNFTVAGLGVTQTFTGINTFTPAARSSGVASYFTLTTPADTGQTAGTESIGANFTAATRQWSTGALTLQRERVFAAPTYSFVGASTLTTAVNVDIAAPIQGTNATITNAYALRAAASYFTGNVTIDGSITSNGGTANGVLYLNGSKVETSGSALTFDGTNFATTGTVSGTKLIPTGGSATGNGMYLPAANTLAWSTNGAEGMRLDSSGNLGLGVTPSAWGSGQKAIQTPAGAIWNFNSYNMTITQNAFSDGTEKYINNGFASKYNQNSGQHVWSTAPSGTAGQTTTVTSGNNYTITAAGGTNYTTFGAANNNVETTFTATSSGTGNGGGVTQNITFTQAMTLDAGGNLLVGGTSSLYGTSGRGNIEINGSSTSILALTIAGSATNASYFFSTSSELEIAATGSRFMRVTTNGSERARITSGGDLLVGQTSPSANTVGFSVNFGQGATIPAVSVAGASSANTEVNYTLYSTTAAAYRFYVGYGGTVYATNTTISAISDQRLKENIVDLDVGLDAVMALKPRRFDWKAGKGKDIKGDRGFIAQEFEQVFPDLIDEWKDPAPEGEEPYKSVRQDLIPVLVKAIQELKAEVDGLKAQLKGN